MSVLTIFLRPLRWLRKAPKTDYEEVLSELTADIDNVQTNLVQVQARKRRATLILPFWAAFLWLGWTVMMYLAGELQTSTFKSQHAGLIWGPVVLVPFLIFFTRRIVRWWYKRVQAAEEEHLKELQRQRRSKIEEIKRATKYDHLRMLLDKYDDEKKPVQQNSRGGAPQTPVKGARQPRSGQSPGSSTVARAAVPGQQPLPSAMRIQRAGGGGPMPAALGRPLHSSQLGIPIQRGWLDRMADSVLGADPSGAVLGPEQKYALICVSCKRHNGLAPRDEFDEVQYICPHCGVFNTRRPSSIPVSSPWRTSTSSQGGPPDVKPRTAALASSEGSTTHAVGPRGSSSSSPPHGALNGETDSPPPASPLGGKSDSDEDVEEHRIDDESAGVRRAGAKQRRSGRLAAMELD